jgi:hypothetical protein
LEIGSAPTRPTPAPTAPEAAAATLFGDISPDRSYRE